MGPRRLIDCEVRQLCDGGNKPYLCLSYVWGKIHAAHGASDGSLPENLPQTIIDAITVTLNIGYRYLWVDRYCIDQADLEAKHDAIQNMDVICKPYYTTIGAST